MCGGLASNQHPCGSVHPLTAQHAFGEVELLCPVQHHMIQPCPSLYAERTLDVDLQERRAAASRLTATVSRTGEGGGVPARWGASFGQQFMFLFARAVKVGLFVISVANKAGLGAIASGQQSVFALRAPTHLHEDSKQVMFPNRSSTFFYMWRR